MRLIRCSCIDSTNRYLRDYHPTTDEDIVVVTADFQTAGKGCGKNVWESEAGKNLLFSILVHPIEVPASHQFLLSMAGGLALYEVLSSYADGFSLKWPNDVYWKDRKISGTLIETKLSGGLIKDCIFGIGLNVNQQVFVSDAPNPVSLCQILGRNVSTDEVLDKVLLSFRKYYERVIAGDEEGILENYLQHLYRREGVYQYRDAEGLFEAEIIRVEPTGILILRDVKGTIRKYAFKEVEFIIDQS